MKQFVGKSVYRGIVAGEILVIKKDFDTVRKIVITDTNLEIERFISAKDKAIAQLKAIHKKAAEEVGESDASIFEFHQMILEDEGFLNAVQNLIITEHANAEYAVTQTCESYAQKFIQMDDEYMKARALDMEDICSRIVRILGGNEEKVLTPDKPSIIVADDLAPSEIVQLDRQNVIAFVTVHGSANSHTAILARTMNIPAMVGVDVDLDYLGNGMPAIVDSINDTFIIEPDEQVIEETDKRIKEESENQRLLETLKGMENETLSGKRIDIFANISSISDLDCVCANDAGGIGLFRSEFLYLGKDNFPTEEEQLAVYSKVLHTMGSKKVIIRTLDIGSDKKADYFKLDKEDNPALGYRGIRICLTQKDIFKTQLRALFRASVSGNLSVMYPMITAVEEVMQIKDIVADVMRELDEEGIPYNIPEQGIMIETPAAVMVSDELAPLVDFFSIGTNDLTQYTLAVDRSNARAEAFYNPHHKAILKMIQIVVDNSHKYGKWTGICGELGADLELTKQFVDMGVDELSVVPSMVLKLRNKIRNLG